MFVCVRARYQTGATGSRQLPLCLSLHQRCRVRFAALLGTEVRLCADACVREMRRNRLIRSVKSHRVCLERRALRDLIKLKQNRELCVRRRSRPPA